jgi:hypothetical protein
VDNWYYLAGCSKDNDADSSNKLPGKRSIWLGSGDWVLPVAYALEQLEADFML